MVKQLFRDIALIACMLVSFIDMHAQAISIKEQIKDSVLINTLTGKRWRETDKIELKSAVADGNEIRVRFNKFGAIALISEKVISDMADSVRIWSGKHKAKVSFFAEQRALTSLVPQNWTLPKTTDAFVVRDINTDDKETSNKANKEDNNRYWHELNGRTFAIWNSHGRYYEKSLDRWEWQRARLYTTVEDLLSSSFVLPFLVPMLENAGAYVLLPRERDVQRNQCIEKSKTNGVFRGTVPEKGEYAIYVKYKKSETKNYCQYIIQHRGGESRYAVDQSRGQDMWIYLGTHFFDGEWSIATDSHNDNTVEVRLGGGMGTIARNGKTSGMPAWMECARYYLEADGFGKTVYAISEKDNDYTDDINGRGEWVNALINDKHINIDASIALHTDAGIADADTTIGTLTIVSTKNGTDKYSNGKSKMIAHDLAQSIEEQIVGDLRMTWDSCWSQRGIWDKGYSEVRRQDVPSVLIELLSHQNINDMHLALHPQFRFDASRAIYKGILKFFEGEDAIVEPLAVSRFGIEQISEDKVRLSWVATPDPLEESAKPERYYVYANDRLIGVTENSEYICEQTTDGQVVTYHIIAENKGGQSFPSQYLAASLRKNAKQAILVDGFDRLAAPEVVNEQRFRGVIDNIEPGVVWGEDVFGTGAQYDFDPQSQWLDDDAPGCGASYADKEGETRTGSHRKQATDAAYELWEEGFSFVSQSKDYFENNASEMHIEYLRISMGRQKASWYGNMPQRHGIYNENFLNRIDALKQTVKELYISGENIGSDIQDEETAKRVEDILGFRFRTDHASKTIGVSPDAIEPAKGARTVERYKDTGMSAVIVFENVKVRGY